MPESSSTLEYLPGRCSCGTIRYRIRLPYLYVHSCHCTYCQRETGSSYALNILIERDQLELLPPQPVPVANAASPSPEDSKPVDPLLVSTPTKSGRSQLIARCPKCFVAVWSHYGGAGPGIAFVRGGTLDYEPAQRVGVKPDVAIYTGTRQKWVEAPRELVDGERVFEDYYDVKRAWGPERVQRFKRAVMKATKKDQRASL